MEANTHASPACQEHAELSAWDTQSSPEHAEEKGAQSPEQPYMLLLSLALLFFLLSLASSVTCLGLCLAASVLVGTWSFYWWLSTEGNRLRRDDQGSREAKSRERDLEARLNEVLKQNACLQEENAKLVSFTTALHPGQGISDLFVSILDDLLEGYLSEDEELHMVREMVQCASCASSLYEYTGSPTELGDLEPWMHVLLGRASQEGHPTPQSLHEITPGLLPFTYPLEACCGVQHTRKDEGQQLQPQPSLTGMLASLASENNNVLDTQCSGSTPDKRLALLERIFRRRDSGSQVSSTTPERAVSPFLHFMNSAPANVTHGKRRASEDFNTDVPSQRGVHQGHASSSGARATVQAGSGSMELGSGVYAIDSGMHASLGLAPFSSRQSRSMCGLLGSFLSSDSVLGVNESKGSPQFPQSAPALAPSPEGMDSKAAAGSVEGTATAISAPHSIECFARDMAGQTKQPGRMQQNDSLNKRDAMEHSKQDLPGRCTGELEVACPPSANSSHSSLGRTQGTLAYEDEGVPAAAQPTQRATKQTSFRLTGKGLRRARTFVKLLHPSGNSAIEPTGSDIDSSLRESKSLPLGAWEKIVSEGSGAVRRMSATKVPEAAQNRLAARALSSAAGSKGGTVVAGVRAAAASFGASSPGRDSPPSSTAPAESNSVQATVGIQQQAGTNATGSMPPVHASRRGNAVSLGGSWQEAAAQPAPSHALVLEMEAVLHQVCECWNCDSFRLCEVTQGHPLSTLGYFIFVRTGLVSSLGIQPVKLARFLRRIEAGYRAPEEVPYHNRVHAADVLQTLHVIMHHGGLLSALGNDPLLSLAAYLSALLHDYEHEGYTNDFIINSNSELAITYNDRAPLENHHLAAGFRVLLDPDYAFLTLTKPEFAKMRKAVIELVLATDMKQHFAHLGHFSALLQKSKSSFKRFSGSSQGNSSGSNPCETVRSVTDTSPRKHLPSRQSSMPGLPNDLHGTSKGETTRGSSQATSLSGPLPALGEDNIVPPSQPPINRLYPRHLSIGSRPSSIGSRPQTVQEADAPAWHGLDLTALDASQRLLLLQIVLKCADIGHLAEDREVHIKWVHRLQEEFFKQGDREKAAGMPVSPLFDRDKPGIVSSQPGFFDVVALPLFAALVNAVPGAQPMMDSLQSNYKYWKE